MNYKPNFSPMKKNILLFLAIILCSFATNAQDTILFEDFNVEPTNIVSLSYEYVPDDEDPTNWISWDSDGIEDNNAEYTSWYWSESSIALQDSVQGGVYMSLSWMVDFSEGNRNWLITPGIELNDDTGVLTWKSAPYQTPLWADGYSVYISTTDNSDLSFTDKIAQYAQYLGTNSDTDTTGDYSLYDFSEGFIHGADGEYIEVDDDPQRNAGVLRPNEVSLAAYAGKTIFIAFVHDSDDDNILFIDDIMVTGNGSLLSTEELSKNQMFKIGPNPTADLLSVSYELNDLSSVIFEVYDINGKKIVEDYRGTQIAGLHQFNHDFSQVPDGNYTVVLKTSNHIFKEQIVIKK